MLTHMLQIFRQQWRALCTKITEVNLSAFIYRLFHEDFSSLVGINPVASSTTRIVNHQEYLFRHPTKLLYVMNMDGWLATGFNPTVEEKSSWSCQQINTNKLTSVIFVLGKLNQFVYQFIWSASISQIMWCNLCMNKALVISLLENQLLDWLQWLSFLLMELLID